MTRYPCQRTKSLVGMMHIKFSHDRKIQPVKQYVVYKKLNANQDIYSSYFRIADVVEYKTKLTYVLWPGNS